MVIVKKVPTNVARTANWLSAELDLADQLAALGFFSSDDDATSTSSSTVTPVEVRRGPKKRYGGISSRRQPSVSAGLIRDVGRKRVGWRRQRRLDNELAVVNGPSSDGVERPDGEIAPELRLELITAPPSAPLASLFRDSDALKKWTEFSELRDDEQQRQLGMLLQTEQHFTLSRGAIDDVDNSKPENFQRALTSARRQLKRVGRPLCKTLRRLASPSLMASIENELLGRMSEAAAAVPTTSDSHGKSTLPVTLNWRTSTVFKAYTERITLDALCRFYDYRLSWDRPSLDDVREEREESEEGEDAMAANGATYNNAAVAAVDNDDAETIEIYSKNWHWPPVRLANIFFLNQQQ